MGQGRDALLKLLLPWLAGMWSMLPLLTADASEKVVGRLSVDLFNRLEAAVRGGPFALSADLADPGRDL